MCGYFCLGFIDFMFKEKPLTKYTNLFSPSDFKRNDDIILKCFTNSEYIYLYKMESHCLECKNIQKT